MRSSTQTECWLAESHMYTHIITKKLVNANCTKMLSKCQYDKETKHKCCLSRKSHNWVVPVSVRGKHVRVFMAELWTTCQPIKGWQLSVCCALFTQHNRIKTRIRHFIYESIRLSQPCLSWRLWEVHCMFDCLSSSMLLYSSIGRVALKGLFT